MSQEHLYLRGQKYSQGLPNKDTDIFPRCLKAELAFPGAVNNDAIAFIQSEFRKSLESHVLVLFLLL